MKLLLLLGLAVSLNANTFYLTVAGLGGAPEYEKQFTAWAQEIDKRLHAVDAQAPITTLSGASATRARVQAAIDQIAHQAKPEDDLVVMLIGHGTFDGADYKMNLPGPDLTAQDLANWLNRVPTGRQLVVNMTSCSGGSMSALEHAKRIVITATRSGSEKNLTVFPRYWVDSLRDDAANTDKNQTLSAIEAFRYASDKTVRFYESEKRLATEHPSLLDTEHGTPVAKPSPENGQGQLAARFPLLTFRDPATAVLSPEKAKLLTHKQDLEAKIDELKYKKAAMQADDYKKQIAALLLDLARTQAELDK